MDLPVVVAAVERERVEAWREFQLVEAGYPGRAARILSRRDDIDLHRAIELLRHGCDVVTALRILR